MTSRQFLWLGLGVCLAIAMFAFFPPGNNNAIPNELQAAHNSNENTDWCTVCVEQKPLYYKFCTVNVTNGDIILPEGITAADFCTTMSKHEVDICLAESCNK